MDEETVGEVLSGWGYSVSRIAENFEQKTPDLLVENGTETYLVEVKSRGKNKPFPSEEKNEPYAVIRRRLNYSAAQLNTPLHKADFRITWFLLGGLGCTLKIVDQLVSNLYGLENFKIEKFSPERGHSYNFYSASALFKPDLRESLPVDVVIIQADNTLYACLNDMSENYCELLNSSLLNQLSQNACVFRDCT